jgi:hypothetical protein
MTPEWVWKLTAAPMSGCSAMKSAMDCASGSLVGIRASADLLMFLAPEGWKVAVQIQTFNVAVGLDVDTVVTLQTTLWHDAVILSAKLARQARREQTRFIGVHFPAAVRIGNAHHQNTPITVHVLYRQTFDVRFIPKGRGV